MGRITFTNRTSSVMYDGNLGDVLRDLSKKENLRSAKLESSELPNSDLEGALLPYVVFRSSDLKNCNFKNASLIYAHFDECDLTGADFSGADLSYASFQRAKVDGAKFTGAHMKGVTGMHIPADALQDDVEPADIPNINHWGRKDKHV